MSLATRAADLFYTFRFVKLLTTKWEDTDAYKLGLVDETGRRIKSKKISSSDEKTAYSTFNRLVFNLKRLLQKVPGGGNVVSSYAAALLLLREHHGVSDKSLEKILRECGIDPLDYLNEANQWYLLEDKQLAPGTYRVRNEKLLSRTLDEMCNAGDRIKVTDGCYPIADICGIDVYSVVHVNTNQSVYVALGELYK